MTAEMRSHKYQRYVRIFIALILVCVVENPAQAASLFDDATMLEVVFEGPHHKLINNKDKKNEQPFLLVTQAGAQNVRIRPRGNSRLQLCNLPPMRVEFDATEPRDALFDGLKKMKIVTPCKRSPSAQSDTLQEYLAYRLFNLVTEQSYRVRLLQMTFVDKERHNKAGKEAVIGFAIEPRKALAKRMGADTIDVPGVSLASLNEAHMARVYVFQYLIGNTDWSLVTADGDDACCHNGDLLGRRAEKYYIPYDFDQSGLVNAHYAKPNASLPIRRVTQRRYRGFCMQEKALKNALAAFKRKKGAMFQELDALPWIQDRERLKSQKFLDGFFQKAENEQKLLDRFDRLCL